MSGLVELRTGGWNHIWTDVPAHYWNTFVEKYPIANWSTKFEADFDMNPAALWLRDNETYIAVLAIFYCFAVHAGIKFMKNRPAFDLLLPLQAWNLFLAVFSIYGAIRSAPFILYTYFSQDATTYMCAPGGFSYSKGSFGFITFLFVLSKVFELIDTVFLVLRKKPVGFLHWFHHASVLIFTWDGIANHTNGALLFMAMNYCVHAIMYTYYFLAAIGKPPAWGKMVTILQITQMVFGSYWSSHLVQLYHKFGTMTHAPAQSLVTPGAFTLQTVQEHGCFNERYFVYSGLGIYIVYLYLFGKFFVERYILKTNKQGGRRNANGAAGAAPVADKKQQ